MMNPQIKAKWVAALRSGEYSQTHLVLNDHVGHCCLGVLCELSKADTGFGIEENLEETGGDENLSETVQQWANLPLSSGDEVEIDGQVQTLNEHNDSGKTFLQIADAIEAQL